MWEVRPRRGARRGFATSERALRVSVCSAVKLAILQYAMDCLLTCNVPENKKVLNTSLKFISTF